MKELIKIATMLLLYCINVKGQYLPQEIIQNITNKKEIKTYINGHLKTHDYFDKNGNLIFSKIVSEDEKILSIDYFEYTEQGELLFKIPLNTYSRKLELIYYDRSVKDEVTGYVSHIWNRNPYDRRTKCFLQKATSIEKLLNNKQVKKLFKGKRRKTSHNYLNPSGRAIEEIVWNSQMDTSRFCTNKYDSLNNLIEQSEFLIFNDKKNVSRRLFEYDIDNNLVKSTGLELSKDKTGKEKWTVKHSANIIYNELNQRIEYNSFGLSNSKYTYEYDDKNRIIKGVHYNENGEMDYEVLYNYEGNKIITKQERSHKTLNGNNALSSIKYTFEISYHNEN